MSALLRFVKRLLAPGWEHGDTVVGTIVYRADGWHYLTPLGDSRPFDTMEEAKLAAIAALRASFPERHTVLRERNTKSAIWSSDQE